MTKQLTTFLTCIALIVQTGCQHAAPTQSVAAFPTGSQKDAQSPTISILLPPDSSVFPMVTQLKAELSRDFNVSVNRIAPEDSTPAHIQRIVDSEHPKLLVLINNPTARLYREWAKSARNPPVALILMASFAEDLQRTIPNSIGISYEVPTVTTLVGLRALGLPADKIGVIHRRSFVNYVARQEKLAGVERIAFVKEELDAEPSPREVKASIVRLSRAGVDALWIPNDNRLLTPNLVSSVWLPYLKRFHRPVIVGVPSLVSAETELGTYAATPDIEALGIQAADLIFTVADAGFKISGQQVQLPLSVKTYLALPQAQELGVGSTKLQQVDFLVGSNEKKPATP